MFGYVLPLRGELKVRDWEDYEAAYCGLCHTLAKRYGLVARFTLNYDFVFLALLLDDGTHCEVCPKRCVAHPFRPKRCLSGGRQMDLAADESVILTYYKLLDGIRDEGFWKGLACRVGAMFLRGAYRKAARRRPDFDLQVRERLGELNMLEAAGSASLDHTADAFASILRAAAPPEGDPLRDRPLEQLLYHLGRWLYLADAVDDLREDREKGRYNPVLARFDGAPDLDRMGITMTHSLSLAQSAFQLLERTRWSDILENILYLGLPHIQSRTLTGGWSKQHKVRSMHL